MAIDGIVVPRDRCRRCPAAGLRRLGAVGGGTANVPCGWNLHRSPGFLTAFLHLPPEGFGAPHLGPRLPIAISIAVTTLCKYRFVSDPVPTQTGCSTTWTFTWDITCGTGDERPTAGVLRGTAEIWDDVSRRGPSFASSISHLVKNGYTGVRCGQDDLMPRTERSCPGAIRVERSPPASAAARENVMTGTAS